MSLCGVEPSDVGVSSFSQGTLLEWLQRETQEETHLFVGALIFITPLFPG